MKRNSPTKKNSGMSLLEVIIAVSIFAIAATILLQGFVTSGRINKKSNLYLEATSTAQNIMEEIKAKDFEEVALAFNYPIDDTKPTGRVRLSFLDSQEGNIGPEEGQLGIKEVIKNGDKYDEVSLYKESYGEDESKVTASVISKDNGRTYKFNPRKTGDNQSKYYFELINVPGNHETFDALIEFDGSKDSGYKKKASGNDEEGKNDYLAPSISKLDSKTNAFLIMKKNWDDNAMQSLATKQNKAAEAEWQTALDNALPAQGEANYEELREKYIAEHPRPEQLDPDEMYEHTRRTLFVKIVEENGIIKAKAKYTLCAYDYVKEDGGEYERMDFCPCKGKGEEGEGLYDGCFCTAKSAYVTFYASEADSDFNNLYVLYYPNYNSTSSVNPLDEFVLDNTTNHPLNFYITKQRDEVLDIPTSVQENTYRTAITIKESPDLRGFENWNTNPSLYEAATKLLTNINYDISDVDKILERPKINQMKLTYLSVSKDGSEGRKVTGNSAEKVLRYNGLDNKVQMDRIYTAKVGVYKKGAAKQNFPDSELIVTLDGAKEN
ncbi:prepilin-type N-terminal cleavage/methylation domain-containing protein [Blautia schinkii]|nr:prepilin-type N-terminal cleavage/methylation domain-containing protein [Blautia schinkii]